MQIILISSPVLEVDPGRSISSSPMESVLPKETVEVSNLAEALAAFDAYQAKVSALGVPAVVSCIKHPRCRSRKPAGFDAKTRERYIHLDKAPRFGEGRQPAPAF